MLIKRSSSQTDVAFRIFFKVIVIGLLNHSIAFTKFQFSSQKHSSRANISTKKLFFSSATNNCHLSLLVASTLSRISSCFFSVSSLMNFWEYDAFIGAFSSLQKKIIWTRPNITPKETSHEKPFLCKFLCDQLIAMASFTSARLRVDTWVSRFKQVNSKTIAKKMDSDSLRYWIDFATFTPFIIFIPSFTFISFITFIPFVTFAPLVFSFLPLPYHICMSSIHSKTVWNLQDIFVWLPVACDANTRITNQLSLSPND